MWKRLRERNEWKFFAVLPQADGRLAFVWWFVLLLRGILPAVFAIAMGTLVAAVQRGDPLLGPLVLTGVVFGLLQILAPLQTAVSQNLGDRTARGVALRSPDSRVRRSSRHGSPRGFQADRRSDGGA